MEEFIEYLKLTLSKSYFSPDDKYEFKDKTYYIKMIYDKKNILNELIGMRLASLFGITCAKYKLFSFTGEYYYVSEDLKCLDKDFILLKDLLKTREGFFDKDLPVSKRSLYALWDLFEKKFTNSKQLMDDLIKIYIFDILFNNPDRHYKNIGIIMPSEKLAILDNEILFENSNSFYISSFWNTHFSYQYDFSEELKEFFLESISYYYSLFKYYYDIFTPDFVLSLIRDIEKEENIFIDDLVLFEKYKKRYEVIANILDEFKNEKSK